MDNLQASLNGVVSGIQRLREENAKLRQAVLREKDEIRKEFEEEINHLRDERNRSWMILSPLEDERLRNFRNKHYQLHKKDEGFISHVVGTGIGTCYRIECPICHESEDITDVSAW